jgi:hypothetical protein
VICQNCGKEGPHYVPPSLGEPGFFYCTAAGDEEAGGEAVVSPQGLAGADSDLTTPPQGEKRGSAASHTGRQGPPASSSFEGRPAEQFVVIDEVHRFEANVRIAEVSVIVTEESVWIYCGHAPFSGEPLEQAIPKLEAILKAARLAANAGKISQEET